MGALLGEVDAGERVLVIEDAPELVVAHPHLVRLVCRAANVEGAGAVGLRELVRQALRMRPDRLVVGEFRGAEMVELLVALNTGHEGSAATLHANSAADVPARFAALGALAGLPSPAVTSLVASAVDLVVHLRRRSGGRRIVGEIGMLSRVRCRAGRSLVLVGRRRARGRPSAAAPAVACSVRGPAVTPTSWLALGIAVLACAAPARAPARLRDLATRDRLAGSTGRSGHGRLAVSRLAGPLGTALGVFLMALVAWRFGPALGVAAGAVLAVGAVLVRDTLAARGEAARRAELRAAVRVLVSELAAGGCRAPP